MPKETVYDVYRLIKKADREGRAAEIPRNPNTERIVEILIELGLVENVPELPKSPKDFGVFTLRLIPQKRGFSKKKKLT